MTAATRSRIDRTEQPKRADETGGHYDGAKCRVDLIPSWFTAGIGWVLTYGAAKYPDTEERANWKGGIKVRKLLASAERHLLAIKAGEDVDPESRLPHWAHMATDVAMAQWMIYHRPDLDDREFEVEELDELAERGAATLAVVRSAEPSSGGRASRGAGGRGGDRASLGPLPLARDPDRRREEAPEADRP